MKMSRRGHVTWYNGSGSESPSRKRTLVVGGAGEEENKVFDARSGRIWPIFLGPCGFLNWAPTNGVVRFIQFVLIILFYPSFTIALV